MNRLCRTALVLLFVLVVTMCSRFAGSFSTLAMGAGFAAGAAKENTNNPRESDRLSTAATALLITGGALTAATVVMVVVNHRKQRDVAVLPVPLPAGAGALLTGRF